MGRGLPVPGVSGAENAKTKKLPSAERIGGILFAAYLFVLIPVLSFYMKDGYRDLGNAKFEAYRLVSLPFIVPLFLCAVIRLVKAGRAKLSKRFCLTDAAALSYAFFLTCSHLLSFDRTESLWGTTGWHLGWLTELLFIAFYFFARLFPVRLKPVAFIGCLCAGAVLLLAITDRLGLPILPFRGFDYSFVSTIGNVDWYCGYLAMACAVACAVLLRRDDARSVKENPVRKNALSMTGRVGALLLLLLVDLSAISQGASAGLIILGISIPAMLAFSAFRSETGRGPRFFRGIFALLLLLIFCGILLLPLFWSEPSATIRLFQWIDPAARLDRSRFTSVPLITHASDEFGNGRGAIWRISWELWRELPLLRRLFGIGPDNFAVYAYASPHINLLVTTAFGAARLTNAHAEMLTVLIDEGILAAVSWSVFMLSACVKLCARLKQPRNGLTLAALFAMVTLGAVQAVTFRTVSATPMLYILIGMAFSQNCHTGENE
ncbi:MAG: O-antigen ligase family protein [Lachnospiraceae bacterium]|nr:O-antigen ligase family protein [Lachnospiraceae bacterium]